MTKFFTALVVVLALWWSPAYAQNGLRETPIGWCNPGSVASAVKITNSNCVFVNFTGVIAPGTNGNPATLTASSVTGVMVGALLNVGQQVVGTNIPTGTYITRWLSGTGGAGTYYLSGSAALSVGSESMTTAGVPPIATYASICAQTQAVNYLSSGGTPTGSVGGGQPIPAGQCIGFNSSFPNFSVIQQAATAVVTMEFYR